MFIKSAASDTLQGKAMQAVNERWGEGRWNGRETIGIAVCKKKYSPFAFYTEPATVEGDNNDDERNNNTDNRTTTTTTTTNTTQQGETNNNDANGQRVVRVERMFGCRCHSDLRKSVILTHGLRKGWEPFGQWSMRKAQELARQFTERLNNNQSNTTTTTTALTKTNNGTSKTVKYSGKVLTCFPTSGSINTSPISSDDDLKGICNNGKCTWKMRAKYDNVYREVTGYSSSDEE